MIQGETPVLSNSLWTATANATQNFPPLSGRIDAEVAIVGGGVTGLSAALHLAERGVSVVLVEAQEPGWGASGRNGGQLNPGLKYDPDAVQTHFGAEMADRMLRLSGEAPDEVMALIRRLGIDCDAVQPGWIQPAHDATSMTTLTARAEQWQNRGVDMRLLSAGDVHAMIGTDVYVGGLLDPRGANLHPLNYTLGLARAAASSGVRIYGKSPAQYIDQNGENYLLRTASGEVNARRILLCTNGYTDGLAPPLAQTLVPVRSIQVATAPLSDNIRRSILPGLQAASDGRRVMVYYKMDGAGRLIIGGRGDYSDSTTEKLMENLRRVARRMFPQLGETPFEYAWGGYVAMTADHYPHLTPLGPGLMSATGYNGRGLALGTVMGRVLADWAMGKPETELDFPVTPPRPIPFHFLRKPAVRATVAMFRIRDALGI
ncbi:MAG: FAD-dependent oxidoreductase [Cereibacter sphaeroides]|uniref:FAD-dependent oxidoreductase n=1 Tax=Cereibacter sphaeroides TaxID=1063 RepID=A0A2W5TY12_CERSP|nr:MAG: FAD-dependent oxidoreductase [Cereibacter sphaeroides]